MGRGVTVASLPVGAACRLRLRRTEPAGGKEGAMAIASADTATFRFRVPPPMGNLGIRMMHNDFPGSPPTLEPIGIRRVVLSVFDVYADRVRRVQCPLVPERPELRRGLAVARVRYVHGGDLRRRSTPKRLSDPRLPDALPPRCRVRAGPRRRRRPTSGRVPPIRTLARSARPVRPDPCGADQGSRHGALGGGRRVSRAAASGCRVGAPGGS
jgi:hypothetical protein